MSKCRFCKKNLRTSFINLGKMPIANTLSLKKNYSLKIRKIPLQVFICDKCLLVQTKDRVSPKYLFKSDYPYLSSSSSILLNEYKKLTGKIVKRFSLNKKKFVIEIASNDGYFLKNFVSRQIPCLGIEPSKKAALISQKKKIPVIKKFYSYQLSKKIKKADLIIANNVLAHVPNLNDFIKGIKNNLKEDGILIIEFGHLLKIIKGVQFDKFYHEHFSYYSLTSIKKILSYFSLKIFDLDKIPFQGGSLRLYICHDKKNIRINKKIERVLHDEKINRLNKISGYKNFKIKFKKIKKSIKKFYNINKNSIIDGYGAGARTVVTLSVFDYKLQLFRNIYDKSILKINRYFPGTSIKILEPNEIKKFKPEYLVIFPWEIKNEIISFIKKMNLNKKLKIVTLFPKIKIFKI